MLFLAVCCFGVYSYGVFFFFFQAEDGIRDLIVTGVQTCALPISALGAGSARYCRRREDRGATGTLGKTLLRSAFRFPVCAGWAHSGRRRIGPPGDRKSVV